MKKLKGQLKDIYSKNSSMSNRMDLKKTIN